MINAKSFREQLVLETAAMARHALASGLKVRPETAVTVEEALTSLARPDKPAQAGGATDAVAESSRVDLAQLTAAHTELCELIKPATPRGVMLLAADGTRRWTVLGKAPMVRRMMMVAVVSLIVFISISLSPKVSQQEITKGLLSNSGLTLLLNELFLMAAAALGAAFAALFKANTYVTEGTFDPAYEGSYWVRLVLGVIAGIFLAELIPLDKLAGGEGDAAADSISGLGKPLLALLGGFSADVVYRIINRIATAAESLVRGDMRETLKAREETLRAQYQERSGRERIRLGSRLAQVQKLLVSGESPEAVNAALESLMSSLDPGATDDPGATAKPADASGAPQVSPGQSSQ